MTVQLKRQQVRIDEAAKMIATSAQIVSSPCLKSCIVNPFDFDQSKAIEMSVKVANVYCLSNGLA